jgi:hypothetical protein
MLAGAAVPPSSCRAWRLGMLADCSKAVSRGHDMLQGGPVGCQGPDACRWWARCKGGSRFMVELGREPWRRIAWTRDPSNLARCDDKLPGGSSITTLSILFGAVLGLSPCLGDSIELARGSTSPPRSPATVRARFRPASVVVDAERRAL